MSHHYYFLDIWLKMKQIYKQEHLLRRRLFIRKLHDGRNTFSLSEKVGLIQFFAKIMKTKAHNLSTNCLLIRKSVNLKTYEVLIPRRDLCLSKMTL